MFINGLRKTSAKLPEETTESGEFSDSDTYCAPELDPDAHVEYQECEEGKPGKGGSAAAEQKIAEIEAKVAALCAADRQRRGAARRGVDAAAVVALLGASR